MSNFKIGEKVVYITGKHLPKYSIWTILNIIHMPCGCIIFDIGRYRVCPQTLLNCLYHKNIAVQVDSNRYHYSSTSFRKLSDFLAEISEQELHEIAKSFPKILQPQTI